MTVQRSIEEGLRGLLGRSSPGGQTELQPKRWYKTRRWLLLILFISLVLTGCYLYWPGNICEKSWSPLLLYRCHVNNDCAQFQKCVLADCPCVSRAVRKTNYSLYPLLIDVLKKAFFRYFRVQLDKSCPLMQRDPPMCMISQCAVEECPIEEIPEIFLNEEKNELAMVDFDVSQKEFWRLEKASGNLNIGADDFEGEDFCVRDDNSTGGAVYVNLLRNPERYTGYDGYPARRIWDAIYGENCFYREDSEDIATIQPNVCFERKVFYKLISGLHSSISAHIAWQYFDRRTNSWIRNATLYETKLGRFPDRIRNLDFLYLFVLRAISQLAPTLDRYNFCSGDPVEDATIHDEMKILGSFALKSPPLLYGKMMFLDDETRDIYLGEYKRHFKNITNLMNCVDCEKCRLWGKLQTQGVGTALKIIFSYENGMPEDQKLERSELVALLNVMGQLSTSIRAVEYFEGRKQGWLFFLITRIRYEPFPWIGLVIFLSIMVCFLYIHKIFRTWSNRKTK
jgi:ERO1-like protein beta